jgi:signal transduction histidine kinase
VRDALARQLGEPDLTLVYRSVTRGEWIDGEGRPAGPPSTEATTRLGGVALVGHRRGALHDAELVRDIARAALPAVEHERLRAELKAQLAELRVSRARIVETGDAERRRLERDLHDGAQQHIVALALDLRLTRRKLSRVTSEFDAQLATVEQDLLLAVAELREVAHGLHPHMLQESGLAAALLALAESDPRLAIEALPEERVGAAAEFAAYQVVAETVRRVPDGDVEVRGTLDGDRLVVEVHASHAPSSVVFLEDRVGALDGRLVVERDGTRTRLRAELPCAS